MKSGYDGFLTLRVAGDVRADLDRAARAAGEKRSAFARRVLMAGLVAMRSRPAPDPDGGPRPGAPGLSMRVAEEDSRMMRP